MVRLALAVTAAAAIIVSAPVVQQAFAAVNNFFPSIAVAATAVPTVVAALIAATRIRHRRRLRFGALALSLVIGGAYVVANALSGPEAFHFVEYGLLAWLIYRAVPPAADGSVLIVPLVAGIVVGVLDEWYQWFVPIRAGELRDVVLDAVAAACGVLFAISADPPRRLTLRLSRESAPRVGVAVAAMLLLLIAFAGSVHVGYEVRDPEIGSFLSRYPATQLSMLAFDRAQQWRTAPPVTIRRFWREDQYLSEGLWHVQRRNDAWAQGDLAVAWHQNLILERFFEPVIDVATYASASPQRWPAAQRDEAASRPGVDRRPSADRMYRWPLYVLQ